MTGVKVFIASALGTIAGILAIAYIDGKLKVVKSVENVQAVPRSKSENTPD
jgi:hypothetical protein